jgi:hypothetical protein
VRFTVGSAAVVLLLSTPAVAQPTTDPAPPVDIAAPAQTTEEGGGDITVVGESGNGTALSADSLRDAARAFERHRAEFAPNARFVFVIEPQAGQTLDGADLRLRSTRRNRDDAYDVIDLPLNADGEFELPVAEVLTGRWSLRTSATAGTVRIRPIILSPGNSRFDRRIGDVRLQCRVAIAFARLGLLTRAAAGAVGPCNSSMVALISITPRPIESVTISGWNQPIEIRDNRRGFRVPLHEDSIGNEDRLAVRLEQP